MSARTHAVPALVGLFAITFTAAIPGQEKKSASGVEPPSERKDLPDLSKLQPMHRAIYLSSRRGAEWLWQANRPDGLFVYGHLPALNIVMDGDNYLHQAGAAMALARAARYTGEGRYAARARQAVLALLADTKTDPKDPAVRFPAFPSSRANRLAAAGLLLLAISELPEPADDLLEQSEQLCQYIRSQQEADGSLTVFDDPDTGQAEKEKGRPYAGQALWGLMRSQLYRPAAWKSEVARKALAFYRPAWQKNKNPDAVPALTSAFTEAYLATKETIFAEFVHEMSDWVCELQLGPNPRSPLWRGGFATWKDGKAVAAPPSVESAVYAEGLADACRVARQAGDVRRFNRYRDAAEHCFQFLTTLQYTPANSRHFADWYQTRLQGAFFYHHQDGNIRVDYTQHTVCAMMHYLQHVAEVAAR